MSRKSPLLLASIVVLATLVVAMAGWWWSSRSAATTPEAGTGNQPKTIESSTGHQRMLDALAVIRDRTDEDNHWQGEAGARIVRQRLSQLPETAPPEDRSRLLVELAEHELRLGRDIDAIALFEQALALGRPVPGDADDASSPEEKAALDRLLFRLGVAYLRYGESQNCATRHLAESCILPISDTAIHTEPEGSEQAIRYFGQVLARTARDSPLHIKALWLFNLAHMTLGLYPDGVPEPYRIPADIFDSEEDFPRFSNLAPSLGLDAFNLSGGAVADDFDGDGHLDLVTTTFDTRGQPHYYRNQGDGTFVDQTREANLERLYGGLNLVQADYDNDGDLDLYVLRGAWLYVAGRHPNSLLRNDGKGRFEDVTFESGLGDAHFPTQTASWSDYDNDGDLDLYVGNEHGDGSGGLSGSATPAFDAPSQLFRNEGDGTFTEVARAAGVAVRAYVKGVIWGDYDNDRFPDLYVSVLGGANYLFHNNQDGTFTDVASALGVTEPINSFPVWFWDYDNDGNLDLYAPSYRGSTDGVAMVAASYFGIDVPYDMPKLYRGDGRGGFVDVAGDVGLDRLVLPMGSNFGDLDGDGWLDFYLGTGYPDYEAVMPNVLYRNVEGKRFADVTLAAGFGHLQKGHAVAFADLDQDGDQDLFAQMGGAFPGDRFSDALFSNPGFGHHWLAIELEGAGSNRPPAAGSNRPPAAGSNRPPAAGSNRRGIGARIRVEIAEDGKRRSIYRHVNSGGSFGCNPLRQTIGLGKVATIEQVEIYWPTTDTRHLLSDVPVDEILRVRERGGFSVVTPSR